MILFGNRIPSQEIWSEVMKEVQEVMKEDKTNKTSLHFSCCCWLLRISVEEEIPLKRKFSCSGSHRLYHWAFKMTASTGLSVASLLLLGPAPPFSSTCKKPDCKQLYCQQDLHCRYSLHESERPCGALAHIIWHSSLNVQEKASSDSDGCISNKGSAIQGCSRT